YPASIQVSVRMEYHFIYNISMFLFLVIQFYKIRSLAAHVYILILVNLHVIVISKKISYRSKSAVVVNNLPYIIKVNFVINTILHVLWITHRRFIIIHKFTEDYIIKPHALIKFHVPYHFIQIGNSAFQENAAHSRS